MRGVLETGVKILEKAAPLEAFNSYDNPRIEDGTYLSTEHIEQIKNDSAITDWEFQETVEVPGIGTLRRVGFVTEKGYAYSGLIGIPEKPESNVPIIGTSAWWTSTEGHNEHTVRNMMRAGNYVFFVGAEGSYEPNEKPEPKSAISLADSAGAVLNFAHHTAKELALEGYVIDLEKRIVLGESRGGMVGMGITALAEEFAQEVILSDFTAPCLPRKMELGDIRHLIEQVVREPIEVAKLLGKLTLGRLIHYPATLDLSPYSIVHQLAIGFALFSGEAGELAKHITNDALMHITVFENDFASMRAEWQTIFKNNPNIRITPLPGSHLTIADLETLIYIIARNKPTQLCVVQNLPLTPQNIFDESHKYAPYQEPLRPAA